MSFLQEGTHREEYRDDDVLCCDRTYTDSLQYTVYGHGDLQHQLILNYTEIYRAQSEQASCFSFSPCIFQSGRYLYLYFLIMHFKCDFCRNTTRSPDIWYNYQYSPMGTYCIISKFQIRFRRRCDVNSVYSKQLCVNSG